METLFADSAFYIALLNKGDQHHEATVSIIKGLGTFRTLTSEMVLAEVLAFFSGRGPFLRTKAVDLVEEMRKNPTVVIVPQTRDLFLRAVGHYRSHSDKNWSLVDCASIIIMEENRIIKALTTDHHFEQAGFRALLRQGSEPSSG